MSKLRNSSLDFSVATLNFLANIGIALPYVLILFKYQQTHSINYLVAIIVFYVARAASVFWTKHLDLKASSYLLICLWLGVIGSLIFSLTSNLVGVIIAALCLGYTSANIWPYYLTIKLHLSESTDFKLKQMYWLIFLGLAVLFGLDFWLDLKYRLAFVLLALLFIIAIPAGKLLNQFSLAFYNEHEAGQHHPVRLWRVLVFIVFFAAIGLLTLLRKVNLTIALPYVLGVVLLAIVLLNVELAADWKFMPANKVRILNRGFLLSFVLLFNSFFGYFMFGKSGMYLVFGLYLLGFEGGRPLYLALTHQAKPQAAKLASSGLILGHLLALTAIPALYAVGLLLIALYIGFENPAINDSVYAAEKNDPDLAIIHKYRFSTYGGLLCQLCFFGLLVAVSALNHLQLMTFFNPSNTALKITYQMGMTWPLVGLSLIISLINLYGQFHQTPQQPTA
ncbi:hypothetical protein D1831_05245 [Lactiplantibacillus garii]|uniref:Uncharacterized protein n=1 Tax=Lactiplantibacillus garii TaxID=2306423 RepID=A0A3R8KM22_9LACO|nr:hypothetical protein [Lactiplantibacillus garii]RRK10837.1 hypothetical protein D1831_05245 [Lactiplantibacillus garii]